MREYEDYEAEELVSGYHLLDSEEKTDGNVEFVSYDGSWPNLCSGILVLKVHGEEYAFGPFYKSVESGKKLYDIFWHSTGSCGFMGGDYTKPHTEKGAWSITVSDMPTELVPYALEILDLLSQLPPLR